ncbi:histidine kinase [Rhodospirillum rubrum]|nr:histidine kinase [Rhodospirillum rubrum]
MFSDPSFADSVLPTQIGTLIVLVAGTVAVLMGGLALRWRSAWLRSLESRHQAEYEAEALREILATASDGYYLWALDGPLRGREFCSRRLAVLLRLPSGVNAELKEIIGVFAEGDAQALEGMIAVLRREGRGFVLDLLLAASGRRVRTVGIRANAGDGHALADLLWMRDVTEETRVGDVQGRRAQALQAERDRLRAVVDALPAPIWTRDDSLAIGDGNTALARALDLGSAGDALTARRELAPGATGQEMRALAARSRAAGRPARARFHAVLDGERKLLEITETPLSEGPLRGHTVGIAQDITPIEEVESRLERETEAHAEVLERLGSAIAIFGGDTRLSFHNAAFASLWGLESDWLNGEPSYGDFLERQRENRRLPEVADFPAYKAGELGYFTKLLRPREDILQLPDGATLRRVIAPHPLGGLITTFEDVTDSLALERSYNQLTAVQRETIDHLHEAVAVFGANGRLRLSNPAFSQLWSGAGTDSEPQAAALLDDMEAAMIADGAWETFRRRLCVRDESAGPRNGRLVRRDGRHLDYATVPLPDGGLLLSILDITDRVRVEQALSERTEALRAADMMKSEFIANVSYELRTPLTTISGFSEILSGAYYGELNTRQREYAEVITETSRQVVRLIDEITDLVSMQAGKLALELDAFDIHAALAAVLALGRESARRRGVTLNFDCPPDAGWMVADETRIKQILFHLMSNAITGTDAGGQVTLAVQREDTPDGGTMVFTVADTGRGMDEILQTRAFESFAKGPRADGAGLGLALVRRFVELHGGAVDLVSVPGEGTTVTVRIPTSG